jgi:hypothetical protein
MSILVGPISWGKGRNPKPKVTVHNYAPEAQEFHADGDEEAIAAAEDPANIEAVRARATAYVKKKREHQHKVLYEHIAENLRVLNNKKTRPSRKQDVAKLLNVQLDREGFFTD